MPSPKTTPSLEPATTIRGRIAQAQRLVKSVERQGEMPVGGGKVAKTLRDEDVLRAAKKALQETNLVVLQEAIGQKRNVREIQGEYGPKYRNEVFIEWQFHISATDLTDEAITLAWYSESYDNLDKALSKAVTMARKDFYRTLLQIPGGPEAEDDNEAEPVPRRARREAAPEGFTTASRAHQKANRPPTPRNESPPTTGQKKQIRELCSTLSKAGYDTSAIMMPGTANDAVKLIKLLQERVKEHTVVPKEAST